MSSIAGLLKEMFSSSRWEDRVGAITGTTLIVDQFSNDFFKEFPIEELKNITKELINDSEYRVRIQLAVLI